MIDALHASSQRTSRTVSRKLDSMLSQFYYEKFAVVTWCILMIICLAFFIGGISAGTSTSLPIANSCLLYAATLPNITLTTTANQTIAIQWGGRSGGFNLYGNNACQSAVIEGTASIMLVLFITLITCVYLYSSPTKPIAQAIAYMSFILTIFMVATTGIANVGLFQTCANSPYCSQDGSNYSLVFGSVIAGWAAAALLFVFTACAWFNVGTHSPQPPDEKRFSSTLIAPGYLSNPSKRYSSAASNRFSTTSSVRSDYNGSKRMSTTNRVQEEIPAWRPSSLNIPSSSLREEL